MRLSIIFFSGKIFLSNTKVDNRSQLLDKTLFYFNRLGCIISAKVHNLNSNLNHPHKTLIIKAMDAIESKCNSEASILRRYYLSRCLCRSIKLQAQNQQSYRSKPEAQNDVSPPTALELCFEKKIIYDSAKLA